MRIVIARLNHETNTFSPVPTPLEAFDPRFGPLALEAARGSRTAAGAFVAFAERRGATTVTPVFATANPSGPVTDAAFEHLTSAILEAVASGADAVLLDLHGAMVTEQIEDAEGELLARIRRIAPDTPVGVALDLHGNITQRMVDHADVLIGFKTYPHVDMFETGAQVAAILERILDHGIRTHRAWIHPPMLAHTLRMNTARPGAMRDLVEAARASEQRNGVLAASVFGGFPLADMPDAGASVLVVGSDRDATHATAAELAAALWAKRADLVYREQLLAESLTEAQSLASRPGAGPVLMLDHGDNCMSGGTCDVMDVVAEALVQGFAGIVAGPICDPSAVAAMAQAGLGARVRLALGHGRPIPSIAAPGQPLTIDGVVEALGSGEYTITGPTYTGMRCTMGRAAVLATDQGRILVSERPHEPWDMGVFTCLGVDPRAARFLILKSRMYCRPVFEPIAKGVVECASRGVTSSDYSLFGFSRLPAATYPIDPDARWSADVS